MAEYRFYGSGWKFADQTPQQLSESLKNTLQFNGFVVVYAVVTKFDTDGGVFQSQYGIGGSVNNGSNVAETESRIKNIVAQMFSNSEVTVNVFNAGSSSTPTPTGNNTGNYTVVSGDTLSRIASRTGTTVANLINLNVGTYPTLRTNPNLIRVGWTLRTSGSATPTPTPTPTPTNPIVTVTPDGKLKVTAPPTPPPDDKDKNFFDKYANLLGVSVPVLVIGSAMIYAMFFAKVEK